MELSGIHFLLIFLTVAFVIGCGIYAARSVNSAEGFSLGGRSAGVTLVTGSIAGTCVGGGATIGTAQMAYMLGLSAWWFTIGTGISLILMGLFYARPLRKTALETIPQYLVLNYGKSAGSITSVVSSLGILFSAVASTLPGIQLIAAILGVSSWSAAGLLIVLVACYVFFGGMRTAGVGGILKMVIVWLSLFIAGGSAILALHSNAAVQAALPPFPWYSFVGGGVSTAAASVLSLIVGMLCTQTYIQAIFSASNPRTASIGAFTAALIVIPVGLPCTAIGMFMHAVQPDLQPILVLPMYLLQYQPVWIAGIAMGGIILSLISSIAGLSLGISTMISHDILAGFLRIKDSSQLLRLNRVTVLFVLLAASVIAIANEGSQVLFWNYLSMALRGGGIFLPLTLAVFMPGRLHKGWTIASMIISTASAILAVLFHSPLNPLFLGLGLSILLLIPALLSGPARPKHHSEHAY